MRIDDPQVLKVCESLEVAAATLRRLAGFAALNETTSRQEGRRSITIAQARTIAIREWDNYPDKSVLEDELADRGLDRDTAYRLIREMEQKWLAETGQGPIGPLLGTPTGATATPGQHTCEPCGTSYPSHKHLLTHRAEDHAGGTDPYNITQEVA